MGKKTLMHFGRVLDDILSHLRNNRSSLEKRLTMTAIRIKKYLPEFTLNSGADPEVELERLIQVLSFSRAYLEVVYDHFPQFTHFRCGQQLSIILEAQTYNHSQFEKNVKWVLSAPMAKHLCNDMAKKPQDDIHLFPFSCGRVRHYFEKILRSRKSKKNLHFFTSLLQGVKRACAPPSERMREKQLESHSKDLMKVPPPLSLDLRPKLRAVLSNLRKIRKGNLKDTGGASYNTTRSMGGKFEEIVRLWNRVTLDEPLVQTELQFMTHTRCFYGRDVPSWSELRTLVGEVDCVKAIGLLEPLKVRVITTGDAAYSCYLEPLRKKVHDYLREIPCLFPLGRPRIEESDLEVLHEKETKLGLNFTHWVSGDYAAATDNLNMNATLQCIEIILQKLGREEDIGILRRSLTETQLKYPNQDHLNCQQVNGQLMGNPMSFPILCLVNLIGYWSSLEEYLQAPVDVNDLPVMINGDDILFRADQEFHDLWVDKVRSLGFSLSVGKYYFHRRVATLNSQFFLDGKEVGYFNPGLLFKDYGYSGNKKKSHYLPLEQILSELLKGSWNRERSWTQFKHYWGSQLFEATSGGLLNIFLPRSAGGLGCQSYGVKHQVTKTQKYLAWALHRHQNWFPAEAYTWTNTPLRENLNKDNSDVQYKNSKCLVWDGPDREEVLDSKLLQASVGRTRVTLRRGNLDEFVELEPQEVYPTYIMNSHLLSTDQIGLDEEQPYSLTYRKECRVSSGTIPIPHIEKPSLESDELVPFERCVRSVPTGSQRQERSYTSEDRLWWRKIDHRCLKHLRTLYGPGPSDLPEPRERRLCRFVGQISKVH